MSLFRNETGDVQTKLTSIHDRLLRDIVTSYLLAGVRVGSWIVVSGAVYRHCGPAFFALLAVIRSAMTPVTYATFNIGPAVVRCVSAWLGAKRYPTQPEIRTHDESRIILSYANPQTPSSTTSDWHIAIATVSRLTYLGLFIGFPAIFGLLFIVGFPGMNAFDPKLNPAIVHNFTFASVMVGLGLLFRSSSEGLSGLLQVRGQLWLDNAFAIICEIFFVLIALTMLGDQPVSREALGYVGMAFAISGGALALLRLFKLYAIETRLSPTKADWPLSRNIVLTGTGLTIGQFADFLYAPFALLLASRIFNANEVADYTAAIMVDSALLLLVVGVSVPLLPRIAIAHAKGQLDMIRRIYFRASLAALCILIVASIFVCATAAPLFEIWIDHSSKSMTELLMLVLIHTTIGGASGVGRAVLIGMGKIRAWTISALAGGAYNVLLALIFTLLLDFGIRGIVLATIISVTARCVIWMPWYILRHTKQFANSPKVAAPMADL